MNYIIPQPTPTRLKTLLDARALASTPLKQLPHELGVTRLMLQPPGPERCTPCLGDKRFNGSDTGPLQDDSSGSKNFFPTGPFTILEPQDPEIGEFYAVHKTSYD